MKSRFTKIAAAALAMTMCVPSAAFATGASAPTSPTSGNFTTSFDIYSPTLTVSVPVNLDVKVNPMANTSGTGVDKYTVASNSIDILNASVDAEADKGIPVNVTVRASITEKADGVITQYNDVTPDKTSAKKNINLKLAEGSGTTAKAKTGETLAFTTDKKLNLAQFEVGTAANYASPTNATPITTYGSLLSVDIGAPTTGDSTAGATFSTDATKVTPAAGSFAVIGEANYSADWKKTDVKVAVSYNIKASNALAIKTPTVTAAPTFTSGSSAADVSIEITNVGEATVTAIALHNDNKGLYGDFVFEEDAYTVAYAPNGTTSSQTDATITIPKDNAVLTNVLTEADYSGKKQDLVIALSDGRFVVSTLTVTKGTN